MDLFNHPDVKNKNLAIIATTGSSRLGKSFKHNYFLRFLYANVSIFVKKIILRNLKSKNVYILVSFCIQKS